MKVAIHNFGFFKLDGGSMFGAVPKALWNNLIPADDRNRIRLATNSLVIEVKDKKILVDTGMGTKWSDKLKDIYGIEAINPLPDPETITDIILTHLHFDHCSGISHFENNQLKLSYPKAKIHLQKINYELALNPNVREKASYLKENVSVLAMADLNLLNGESEIYPGISVHPIHGHTAGQQWIKVTTKDQTYAFPSDLVPTTAHLQIPYHMGYDMCTTTLLKEKEDFLNQAIAGNWEVIFQHDPLVSSAKISNNPLRLLTKIQ